MQTLLLLLASCAILLPATITGPDQPCRAWLQATSRGPMLELTGNCSSLAGMAGYYRYEMRLERHSAGGHSTSQQGGEFALATGESVVLSSTRVNLDGRSTYVGHLRIFDSHDVLLAQDSVRHEPGDK